MPKQCSQCRATRGAHFGWCIEVGGLGKHPADLNRSMGQPALGGLIRATLLAEARASVALDGETQSIEPPAPAPVPPVPEQAPEPPPASALPPSPPERVASESDFYTDGVLLPAEESARRKAQVAEQPSPTICGKCGQAGGRHALNCGMRITLPRPDLKIVPPPRLEDAAEQPPPRYEGAWRWSGPEPDWDNIGGFELESTANDILANCLRGLPAPVPFLVRDDVLAMEGYHQEDIESALRQPDHVEIRPETYEKGYPILGFRRGDVRVILGLRTPRQPAVIAAYWTSLLTGYDPSLYRHRTGGGGSKASSGVPTSASALVKRLRAFGAHVSTEHHPDADLTGQVTITYHGQDLGKISVGKHVPKQTVDSDFQRMQRKIHAIDLRETSVGGRS